MISVLMLTYNREHLVARAIESVLAQTYQNFEYVVVDNGSTDESGTIADMYAKKDSRVRVIHRPRGNISSGRNIALDAAKGEHIAFVDDDDWCEPDFLEFLYRLIVEYKTEMSICGAADKIFDEKLVMTGEGALIELLWRKRFNMAFPTKLFHRDLVKNLRFPENRVYDDIALMYRLFALSKRIAYHGLPKYTFHRHNNNSAWTTNHRLLSGETLEEYLHAYRERTEWLSALFPDKILVWRYFEWSFMISMIEKIARLSIQGCDRQVTHMARELQIHREKFLNCGLIRDFEREWVRVYIDV